MDKYDRCAAALMELGDSIIEEKKNKSALIRRVSFSVSGLCAAALLCFGIWKTPALQKPPEIPQVPEIEEVTEDTTAAETAAAYTETAEAKTTKAAERPDKTTEAAAVNSTADIHPSVMTDARTSVQPERRTEAAAQTAAPAVNTERSTAAETTKVTSATETTSVIPETEATTQTATEPPAPATTAPVTTWPASGGGTATPPVTQAPSQQPVVPRTIVHHGNTGGASGEETHTEVSGTAPVQNATEPSVYVLPTTPDDPNGIKAVCREYGLPDIAPSYIPAGFELTDLFLDDSSLGTELIFTYTRKAADGGYEYISLFYGISKQPGNFSYFDMIIPPDDTELKAFDINGHELQYYYSSSESTLKGLYMTDAFLFNLYTTGLNKYYAERVVRSVS